MLAAIFDGHSNLPGLDQNSLLFGKDILHFAPERHFRDRIRKIASQHTHADYNRGDCDLKLNMSAMRALYRILKIGGTAILTVSQKDPPSITDEDSSVTEPANRESRFDQITMFGCMLMIFTIN